MLQKFKSDWGFFFPLLVHSGVHALCTLVICLVFAPYLWWLALVDLVVHFVMDRIKAGPKYLGRFKPLTAPELKKSLGTYEHAKDPEAVKIATSKLRGNVFFWWALGLDQMIHHLTHYIIIATIIMYKIWDVVDLNVLV